MTNEDIIRQIQSKLQYSISLFLYSQSSTFSQIYDLGLKKKLIDNRSDEALIRIIKIFLFNYNFKFLIKSQSLNQSSVCFSPDGTTLASGGGDQSIRLWDVKTGQQKAKLDGHSDYVRSVCFSPDGTTLASVSGDESIRLWDVKKGQQKAKQDGHENWIYSVGFSPDGTTLASGSNDNSIRLWDVKTGQQKAKLDGHDDSVYSVCFSPDGTTLASGSGDKSIRLWDVKTGQQKAKLDGHNSYVMSVCFSPDGTSLASGSYDNSIRLWDIKTGQQIQPSDPKYKALLSQFKIPINTNNSFTELNSNLTILLISQQAIFQAQGALILQGSFVNQSGFDLKTLFKQKGTCFVETYQFK
ncbi:unnamed protein product [Paramecium sonneborni]|uniref:EML-like second beta-propeller domain-containing protein n=1 Tax=Paramecium sonneborni TaxID=65129 RepID=A0A8S1RV48_9CILI|nr:unnamed protein product [Paramecium sonneborni]